MHNSSLRLQLQHPFVPWPVLCCGRLQLCLPGQEVGSLSLGHLHRHWSVPWFQTSLSALHRLSLLPALLYFLCFPTHTHKSCHFSSWGTSLHNPSSSRQVDSWARNFASCSQLLILLLLLKTGACKYMRSHSHQGWAESNFATWYSAGKEFQVWSNQVLQCLVYLIFLLMIWIMEKRENV